jgi:MSHA type pilus biogenesis protein MshL
MKYIVSSFILMSLFSCAIYQPREEQNDFPRFHPLPEKKVDLSHLSEIPVALRTAWPEVKDTIPLETQEELYSFIAEDMPINKAIELFSRSYGLNILADKDVVGSISVNFHSLPFEQAMSALLSSMGYYWQKDNQLIRVRSWETRLFNVNYIRLNRIGSGESSAQVSSGINGSEGNSGGGDQAGEMKIEQENEIEFWDDLEKQLNLLVSEEGRLVINKVAGTVQITDRHPRVEEFAQYINDVNSAISRQVKIEVKILEVTLNKDFSLGVDWSRIGNASVDGFSNALGLNNIITAPTGSGVALQPTFNLSTNDITSSGANISTFVSALEEQGEVQVISQPHIRTLNNQSALIKVGTDRTFFRRERNTETTEVSAEATVTDVPQVITEGIVLSITPQISSDGWVIMDVSPVVTRVASVSEVKDDTNTVVSTAPNLDIRQSSSLVRAFNGETVVIGGLIQTQESKTNRGIPGIKNVKGLGKLFEGDYTSTVKKELIIFLTPTLVDTVTVKKP